MLKERNLLSTLDRECEENEKMTPNDDRIDKVEESLENILKIVEERDSAYKLLEHDRSRPEGAYAWNIFGFRYWKRLAIFQKIKVIETLTDKRTTHISLKRITSIINEHSLKSFCQHKKN